MFLRFNLFHSGKHYSKYIILDAITTVLVEKTFPCKILPWQLHYG